MLLLATYGLKIPQIQATKHLPNLSGLATLFPLNFLKIISKCLNVPHFRTGNYKRIYPFTLSVRIHSRKLNFVTILWLVVLEINIADIYTDQHQAKKRLSATRHLRLIST